MKKRALEAIARSTAKHGFGQGLLLGLAAGGMVLTNMVPRAKVPTANLGDDWKAVGRDLEAAISQYDRKGRG